MPALSRSLLTVAATLIAPILTTMCAGQAFAADPGPKATVGFPASMSLKDRIEIVNSAGYQITPNGQTVSIYCGDTEVPVHPVVASIDFTGDGKPDYLFLSEHNCPGETPVPIQADIVAKRPDGVWQNILSVQGAPKPGAGTTDGWRDLNVTSGTQVTPYVHDPVTERYASVSTLHARKNLALAAVPTKTAPGVMPTSKWAAPYVMGDIPPGDLAAILIAAGYKHVKGKWKGCNGTSDVALFEDDQLGKDGPLSDLNGDGQPEVMVSDASTECYGDTGTSFSIVTPVPGGWKLIFTGGEGVPEVQPTRSKSGWRDVVAGGPGFCHRLYRYNGKTYADFSSFEETKGACSR